MLEKYEHKQLMCGEGKSLIFSSDISVICQPLWGTYKPVQICGQSHLRMVTVTDLRLNYGLRCFIAGFVQMIDFSFHVTRIINVYLLYSIIP